MKSTAARYPSDSGASLAAALGLPVSVVATLLAMSQPLYGVALVYMTVYLAVAWKYPHVAVMLVFASAPFQTDVSGGGPVKFSIAEVNLTLTFVVFVLQNVIRKRPFSIGPIAVPVLLYLGTCLLSSAHNGFVGPTLISLIQMLLYFIVAVMVFSTFVPKPERLLLSLYGLVCVGVFLAPAAVLSTGTGSNYILGLNKNGVGASLTCALIVCVELWFASRERAQKLLLTVSMAVVAAGLLFTLSRGAWLGAFVGLFMIAALRRQYTLLIRASLVLLPLLTLCWLTLPQESREYATDFSRKRYNIAARYYSMEFAKKHFETSPVYGVGVHLRKQYDASNVVWSTLAETGVLGLAAFLLIHIVFLAMVWKTQKRVTRTDKLYSLLAIGGALVFAKLAHAMVDHYWSRGSIMITWGGVGMATSVYFVSHRLEAVRNKR